MLRMIGEHIELTTILQPGAVQMQGRSGTH